MWGFVFCRFCSFGIYRFPRNYIAYFDAAAFKPRLYFVTITSLLPVPCSRHPAVTNLFFLSTSSSTFSFYDLVNHKATRGWPTFPLLFFMLMKRLVSFTLDGIYAFLTLSRQNIFSIVHNHVIPY